MPCSLSDANPSPPPTSEGRPALQRRKHNFEHEHRRVASQSANVLLDRETETVIRGVITTISCQSCHPSLSRSHNQGFWKVVTPCPLPLAVIQKVVVVTPWPHPSRQICLLGTMVFLALVPTLVATQW